MPAVRSQRDHWACLLVVIVLAGAGFGVLTQIVSSLSGDAAHLTGAPLQFVPTFTPR